MNQINFLFKIDSNCTVNTSNFVASATYVVAIAKRTCIFGILIPKLFNFFLHAAQVLHTASVSTITTVHPFGIPNMGPIKCTIVHSNFFLWANLVGHSYPHSGIRFDALNTRAAVLWVTCDSGSSNKNWQDKEKEKSGRKC